MICGNILHGRIDKKFCSDHCRNKYHNSLNSNEIRYIRTINYILRKNRRILLELERSGTMTISKSNLAQAGFDFNFFTGVDDSNKGNTRYYCYEHGYFIDQKGTLTLIKKKIFNKANHMAIGNGLK